MRKRIVRVPFAVLAFALVSLVVAGCATTSFVSTWKEPSWQGVVTPPDHTIAAFMITDNEGTRRAAESYMAEEIAKGGAKVVPGYTLVTAEDAKDQEKVKEILKGAGVDGAVIMRVVGKDQESRYVPGTTYYTTGYYPSFYGYWGSSWGMMYDPGYVETDVIVSVETLLYSVEEDKLLWAGTSETTNPSKLDAFIRELVEVTRAELKKEGLLAK
jgi:hypothetical protein